ncbi:MAG TPA: cytochrome c biogenesis protein ResB, partial [Cryobacterium sp.]|nr:cytochrome c biogenesis protein ResB [Cryobacterium sp.]
MSRPSDHYDSKPAPADDGITQPRLGVKGLLRWFWRQLTSMRTALFLLLLLAIAAVPGSLVPQRSSDPNGVTQYFTNNPTLAPALDKIQAFDVYSSAWFSAIYLLLFVSLIGCVIPRTKHHLQALRAKPPKTPARLARLAGFTTRDAPAGTDAAAAIDSARSLLKSSGYRVARFESAGEVSVSAERGYLRETGNLVFHVALIVVIVAVAIGHLFGWRGDRILVTGKSFSNTISGYDTFDPGPWVDTAGLSPFTVAVDRLDVTFEEHAGGAQRGAPRDFTAYTRTQASPDAPEIRQTLKVNSPLVFGGASVFLLGNGYAPVITVRDAAGQVLMHEATPFLPQDANYRSVGAVKVSAASPRQLGFFGFFLPSEYLDKNAGPSSFFPDLKNPALALGVYEGELYPQGRPQSVYTLSTEKMTQLKNAKGEPLRLLLKPGQTIALPGGRGSITFDAVQRWAGLSIRYDPGKILALAGAVAALAGLIASLMIRRRRIFVRVRPQGRRTVVSMGGIAKG